MNDIQAIRNKLGLSQRDLARYLGITRTLLSMFELNKRPLPTPVLLKLAKLQLQVTKTTGSPGNSKDLVSQPGQPLQHKQAALPNRPLHTRQDCQHSRLQLKLAVMKRQYQHLVQVRATLERLLQDKSGTDPVHSYLQAQFQHVLQKARACGPEAQDMLNRKISALGILAGRGQPKNK